jgi:hypothetical protein
LLFLLRRRHAVVVPGMAVGPVPGALVVTPARRLRWHRRRLLLLHGGRGGVGGAEVVAVAAATSSSQSESELHIIVLKSWLSVVALLSLSRGTREG